jgi:adenosine deaminase
MYAESHRHLSGSITPETIWEIIKDSCDLSVAKSLNDVKQQVCLVRDDADFDYFCTRLDILNKLKWSDWALCKIARQVLSDIKAEGIDHCTLTVSLNKFIRSDGLAAAGYRVFGILGTIADEIGVDVNYLLSISYSWPLELQFQMLNLIGPLGSFVAGVDFVGDESVAKWHEYTEPLASWKQQEKTIRVHVGERFGTSNNIDLALKHIDITRIAHGIYSTKEQQLEAIRRGIVFDMSLHSNIYTHAIELSRHPIKQMQEVGCAITLGADDPVQFNCTLYDEYALAAAMGVDKVLLQRTAFESRIL